MKIWSPHLVEQQLVPFADMLHQLQSELNSINFDQLREAINQLRDGEPDGEEQADSWLGLAGMFWQTRNTLNQVLDKEQREWSN